MLQCWPCRRSGSGCARSAVVALDYLPSPLLIESVDLDIDIFDGFTVMTNTMTLCHNPAVAAKCPSIVLDGDPALNLEMVSINGHCCDFKVHDDGSLDIGIESKFYDENGQIPIVVVERMCTLSVFCGLGLGRKWRVFLILNDSANPNLPRKQQCIGGAVSIAVNVLHSVRSRGISKNDIFSGSTGRGQLVHDDGSWRALKVSGAAVQWQFGGVWARPSGWRPPLGKVARSVAETVLSLCGRCWRFEVHSAFIDHKAVPQRGDAPDLCTSLVLKRQSLISSHFLCRHMAFYKL